MNLLSCEYWNSSAIFIGHIPSEPPLRHRTHINMILAKMHTKANKKRSIVTKNEKEYVNLDKTNNLEVNYTTISLTSAKTTKNKLIKLSMIIMLT